MNIAELLFWIFVVAGVGAIIWVEVKVRRSVATGVDDAAPHTTVRQQLPSSGIASLAQVLGIICILGGLWIIAESGDPITGYFVVAGAFGFFVTASLIQYVFDIRNILLRQERSPHA